jgi:hypothetical protein
MDKRQTQEGDSKKTQAKEKSRIVIDTTEVWYVSIQRALTNSATEHQRSTMIA